MIKKTTAIKKASIGKTQRKKILGFFGDNSDDGYKHDKDVISKEINGERITCYSDIAVKHHAKVNPRAWESSKEYYLKITPKWYISTQYMTKGAWAKLSGIKVFDWAVPYEWQKKNQAELNKRGGAVWWYDNDKRWGEPLFMDTIKTMAIKNLKKHL